MDEGFLIDFLNYKRYKTVNYNLYVLNDIFIEKLTGDHYQFISVNRYIIFLIRINDKKQFAIHIENLCKQFEKQIRYTKVSA